jgi:hypothetical protein
MTISILLNWVRFPRTVGEQALNRHSSHLGHDLACVL